MNAPHSKYPLEKQSSARLIDWMNRYSNLERLSTRMSAQSHQQNNPYIASSYAQDADCYHEQAMIILNFLRTRKVRVLRYVEGYRLGK